MGKIGLKNRYEIIALLQWYKSAGVDIAINETAANQFSKQVDSSSNLDSSPDHGQKIAFGRVKTDIKSTTTNLAKNLAKNLAPPHAPLAPPHAPLASPHTQNVSTSKFEHIGNGNPKEAIEKAQGAKSLAEIKLLLEKFDGCALKERASQLVFGIGNPKAKIMFIGKAPGREEDMTGTPFAGKVGELLDKMLGAISIKRDEVFLSYIVPWRPPGNRDLAPQEIALCLPFLQRQVELVAPDYLITFGDVATRSLLGKKASVLNLGGQWNEINVGKHKCKLLATLPPDFLLKQPAQKRIAWRDLCCLRDAL